MLKVKEIVRLSHRLLPKRWQQVLLVSQRQQHLQKLKQSVWLYPQFLATKSVSWNVLGLLQIVVKKLCQLERFVRPPVSASLPMSVFVKMMILD